MPRNKTNSNHLLYECSKWTKINHNEQNKRHKFGIIPKYEWRSHASWWVIGRCDSYVHYVSCVAYVACVALSGNSALMCDVVCPVHPPRMFYLTTTLQRVANDNDAMLPLYVLWRRYVKRISFVIHIRRYLIAVAQYCPGLSTATLSTTAKQRKKNTNTHTHTYTTNN